MQKNFRFQGGGHGPSGPMVNTPLAMAYICTKVCMGTIQCSTKFCHQNLLYTKSTMNLVNDVPTYQLRNVTDKTIGATTQWEPWDASPPKFGSPQLSWLDVTLVTFEVSSCTKFQISGRTPLGAGAYSAPSDHLAGGERGTLSPPQKTHTNSRASAPKLRSSYPSLWLSPPPQMDWRHCQRED